jgi:hypothetical protein
MNDLRQYLREQKGKIERRAGLRLVVYGILFAPLVLILLFVACQSSR